MLPIVEKTAKNYCFVRAFKLFVAVSTLLYGSFLYIGFRSKSLLMFDWTDALHLGWLVESIRSVAAQYETSHHIQFVYSFPYALWVISFCSSVGFIWHREHSNSVLLWRLAGPTIAIGSEIQQLLGLLPGTFDVMDLLVLALASIIGIIFSFI